MKTLFRIFLLLVFSQFAFSQVPTSPIPVCNGSNGANCTDYFGVANWANSPLPAGSVTSLTLVAGGSGYSSSPTVQITDLANSGTGATASVTVVGGVITGITLGGGGTGYIMPQVMIMDSTGSGAMATAVIGGPLTGGIKKFTDAFFDLKNAIATADQTTFPNSDYYEIALVEYQQQMSSSLPAKTTLRGYVQVPSGSVGCAAAVSATPNYLGPVILAQKNRPVRVKFTNCLPTKSLFIPVDSTYMGAGMSRSGNSYSDNRATLHLHGGATPWISDGTPHQWTVPVGDASPDQKGDSVANVPDMWFDGTTGAVISSCAGLAACPVTGATQNPGQGSLTFFWTNEQGGRLMFFHDHAYGLTRLNVYAGEAAGYLLYDPTEETSLLNATVPGTIATNGTQTAPDLSHLIPLVIQDKTFVPTAPEIDATDPTWKANFGTAPGTDVTGDLWFPHVYTTNQNPNDLIGGSNAFGRWDYGPWFFPPQTSLTAAPAAATNGVTLSCTSSAFPGQTLAPSASCPSCGCPIIPNPSGTPEGFMDTPIVNGVAYPVLHVAPAAYRFKILSAGNDRSWNLSWFVADSTQNNTEVAMVPAAPPAAGALIPLCSAINPVAVPMLGLGLVSALLDGNGNPLNGTGLPAGCWPNYGPLSGIPAPQTMWAADGRSGGAPDPRTAGPAWVQIGSEGGLLPTPVVIPPTPINYEENTRSITITNVAAHGLWLGPAERADVIVDFSQFAGKTLILYNDAPTPVPAFDSRLDYFTGDGDQTSIGGAPNTPAGYGPNTRTVMQVVVDGSNPNTQTFSLSALKSAFASTTTTPGIFAQTQPTAIVPEPAYNSAYNGIYPNAPVSNVPIAATTFTFNPYVAQAFNNPCTPGSTTCDTLDQKTIQELFTVDYGRMNATLGTELPNVNFTNQTTIPLGYVDPATEIIRQGNTQIWKITHNGVDTHFIHFHLFNVQVINRVGWDGSIRQIDPNEAGWKDTVRMNPLEDITVALQPITPTMPFPIPNSVRLLDVTTNAGTGGNPPFSNLDPYTNAGINTVNALQNFGWEYVWHCHILGHEENDMMRPMIFQVPPAAPSNLVAATDPTVSGQVDLAWTDNSASETGFVVERDVDPAFSNPTLINVGPSSTRNAAGEGTDWGSTISTIDTPAPATYFYRVQAVDNGWAGSLSQTYNASILGSLSSGWSNVVTLGTAANATASPNPLNFGNQLVNTSASQTVTVSNGVGAGTLAITSISVTGANATDFTILTNTCGSSLLGGATCAVTVAFKPAASGSRIATLAIASSNPTSLSVSLLGNGIAPVITPSSTSFAFGNVTVGVTSAAQTLTITNTGSANLIFNTVGLTGGNAGDFATVNSCPIGGAGIVAGSQCTINLTFKPTAIGARSTVLVISSSDPVTPLLNVSLSGFGTQSIAALSVTSLTFPLQLVNTVSATQLVTLFNTGNVAFTISSVSLTGTNATDYVLANTCPIGGAGLAAGANCTFTVAFRPAGAGTRTASVSIATNANVNPNPAVALSGTATQINLDTKAIAFAPQVVGTQSASQSVTLFNIGTATVRVNSIGITGTNPGDFSQTNNCPIGGNLGAGSSCRINVRFTPTAVGTRAATLSISTNDPGTPTATVSLSGTGVQVLATLTPTSHNFGSVAVRTTSAPFAFTLTNTGSAVLTINGISIGGANANRFNQTNNCAATLAIGATCTINVTFSPQQRGNYAATLQVRDNATGSPQTAGLSGTGQ